MTNDFGFDSTFIEIPCNSSVMLTKDGGQGAQLWMA